MSDETWPKPTFQAIYKQLKIRIVVNVQFLLFQLSVAASLRRFKTATLTGSARLSVAGSATSVGPDTSWWEDSTDIAKPTDRGVQEFYLNVFVSIATNIRNSQRLQFAWGSRPMNPDL